MNSNALTIWHFEDAPEQYKALSQHGGDEDWVLFAPKGTEFGYWPYALENVLDGSEDSYHVPFGHVDRHVLPEGTVVIFAHA